MIDILHLLCCHEAALSVYPAPPFTILNFVFSLSYLIVIPGLLVSAASNIMATWELGRWGSSSPAREPSYMSSLPCSDDPMTPLVSPHLYVYIYGSVLVAN
jgi:hypothetical protein